VSTLTDLVDLSDLSDLAARARARTVLPLMPRTRMNGEEMVWEVVNARDGSVVWPMSGPPAGSESRGV